MNPTAPALAYQYLVLRCVPRADREEFLNVGVVLYCQRPPYLGCRTHLDGERLRALDPAIDIEAVAEALTAVDGVCRGDESSGSLSGVALGTRFGHLAAPRSTVVRPGPVHGGLTSAVAPSADLDEAVDPTAGLTRLLDHLLAKLVLTHDASQAENTSTPST